MRQIILDFPEQFRVGLEAAKNIKVKRNFDKVLICGMGGSALPGDLLKMWLQAYKIALPLHIWRNYSLPHFVDQTFLVICISYSGNTEEVLSSFREAKRKNLPQVSITSGGRLAELCKRNKVPLATVPGGLQPRMALGYQFSALMEILVNCGLVKNNLGNLLALEKKLKPKSLEKEGRALAKKIKNPIRPAKVSSKFRRANGASKIPIIYASERLEPLARIWKIKFNENSKIPAFSNHFPELNHNEMVGFEKCQIPWTERSSGLPVGLHAKCQYFHVFILRDLADHPRILKRMKLTAEILKNKGIEVDFIEIKGRDILFKIFSNLLLSDWVSYYLALERKVDPIPVKIVEEFKKKLSKL